MRRGRGGAVREHGGGFVAAAFRHRTSRARDPHLHTHVLWPTWRRPATASGGRSTARPSSGPTGWPPAISTRRTCAARCARRSACWREPVRGMAEIEGVPDEAIRTFSTRRRSLVEHMEAMGTSAFAAAQVAALATRGAQGAGPPSGTTADVDRPRRGDGPRSRRVPRRSRSRGARGRAGGAGNGRAQRRGPHRTPDDLHEGSSARWRRRTRPSTEVVLAAAERIVETPRVLPVGNGPVPERPARFAADELVELERERST